MLTPTCFNTGICLCRSNWNSSTHLHTSRIGTPYNHSILAYATSVTGHIKLVFILHLKSLRSRTGCVPLAVPLAVQRVLLKPLTKYLEILGVPSDCTVNSLFQTVLTVVVVGYLQPSSCGVYFYNQHLDGIAMEYHEDISYLRLSTAVSIRTSKSTDFWNLKFHFSGVSGTLVQTRVLMSTLLLPCPRELSEPPRRAIRGISLGT